MSDLFTPVYFNKCIINWKLLFFNLDHNYMLIYSILQVQQVFDEDDQECLPAFAAFIGINNEHICREVFNL